MNQDEMNAAIHKTQERYAESLKPHDDGGWPENKAELVWEYKGAKCSIVKNDHPDWVPYGSAYHYCGYARFSTTILPVAGYDFSYKTRANVDVHGGLTWYHQSMDESVVYGFDCAHLGDDQRTFTTAWLQDEIEHMVDQLIAVSLQAAVGEIDLIAEMKAWGDEYKPPDLPSEEKTSDQEGKAIN